MEIESDDRHGEDGTCGEIPHDNTKRNVVAGPHGLPGDRAESDQTTSNRPVS